MKILIFVIVFGFVGCNKNDLAQSKDLNSGSLKDSLDLFFNSPEKMDVVFTNVNVVTMQKEEVLINKDVFVSNGLIKEIVNSGTSNTDNYLTIDAKDKYLSPGLSDLHIHPVSTNHLIYDLFLYLAKGLTTVRVMWGFDEHVELRNRINAGEFLGPNMYVASAGFDGANNTWPGAINTSSVEEIRSQIDRLSEKKYDFIKVYSGLNTSQYLELVEYAWTKGIPPIGHVPSRVDAKDAISKLKSISHLGKFRSSSLADDQLFTALASSSTAICPTMTVLNRIKGNESVYLNEWYEFVSPEAKTLYDYTKNTLLSSTFYYESISNVLEKIHNSGATIIAGTDTGIRYVLPGVSLHEELGYYVETTMTPYEALRTATTNAATFLEDDLSGTIKVGNKADLILLESNPLIAIESTEKILGVMKDGHWISSEKIDEVLSLIRSYYKSIE